MEKTHVADDVQSESTTETEGTDKALANLVNKAVSAQLGRHLSKLPDMLDEILSKKQQKPVEPVQSTQPASQTSDDPMKAIAAMKAELRAEKQKIREEKAFSEVRNKLSGKVRDDAMDVALKLIAAERMLQVGEDGVKWRMDGIEMDVDEGLNEWLSSKDAALFKSAPVKRPGKSTIKAPQRMGPAAGVTTNPTQATLAQLAKLGITL